MSKKKEDKKKKNNKKQQKSGFGGCLLTLLIVIVVLCGAIVGGGIFAWGRMVEPVIGISISEAYSLSKGLYKYDEDAVVTNSYDKTEDLAAFYNAFKDALFLTDDCDIESSMDDVIASILAGDTSNTDEAATAQVKNELYSADGSETGNGKFDAFLQTLNFDFSTIKDYQDEYATPNVLSITDKELAAFLNKSIEGVISNVDSLKSLSEQYGINFDGAAEIAQVIINSNAEDFYSTSFTATVKIKIRDVVSSVNVRDLAVEKLQDKGIPDFVYSLIPESIGNLVPETVCATITIYPYNSIAQSQIKINEYDSEKMDLVYKVINSLTNKDGETTIESMLVDINSKAVDAIVKVQEIVPIEFTSSGSAEMRPIKTVMNMLGLTNLTETQFFCMIRDIALPTFDDVDETLGFVDGTTYDSISTAIDNELNTFIGEIEQKYAIDNSDHAITSTNIYSQLMNINGENGVINKINLDNLTFEATYDADLHKANITYPALAGLLKSYLATTDSSSMNGISFDILNTGYESTTNSIELVIAVDVKSMIEDKLSGTSSKYTSLINQIMPSHIYLTASVGLDPDGTTAIKVNNCSAEDTQKHLDTIADLTSSMGVSLDSLNIESLTSTLKDAVSNGIQDIETKLGTPIVFKADNASLPSVFEVVAKSILYKEEEEKNLTDEELYYVFKDAVRVPDEYATSNKAANNDSLFESINTKYYITTANQLSSTAIDAEGNQVTMLKQLSNLSANYSTAIDGAALATDWTEKSSSKNLTEKENLINSDFRPEASAGEMVNIFSESVKVTTEGLKDLILNQTMVINASTIQLVYIAKLDMNDNKYQNIVPESFAIVVDVDLSKMDSTTEQCIAFTINAMSQTELDNFALIALRLGGKTINYDEIRSSLDEQVKTHLASTIKSVPCVFESNATGGKMILSSIYDIVATKSKGESDTYTNVDIANTISALFEELDVTGQNEITASDMPETEGDSAAFKGEPNIMHVPPQVRIYGSVTGRNLGAMVLDKDLASLGMQMGLSEENAGGLALYQTAFIAANDDSLEAVNNRESLSNSGIDTETSYSLLSFKIALASVLNQSDNTLLPENIYVTGLVNMLEGTTSLIYNNLSDVEMAVLLSLATNITGSAPEFLNNAEAANKIQTYLNDLVLFEYRYTNSTYGIDYTKQLKFGEVITEGTITAKVSTSKVDGLWTIDKTYDITL